ncbi:MAG: ROK family protein [Candidatus Sphingomonas phytovorans]|nr:ROK family protein [Sphingomonas sp.]WEK00138.1 MAG: ROK family protein [Sphingomonas sp.]
MSAICFVGVETGGTKTLCRIDQGGETIAEERWATTTAEAAADAVEALVARSVPRSASVAGIGLAAFGPLVVARDSPDRGLMLETSKPGWAGSNLRASLAARLGAPTLVDTDVSAAAFAEQRLGSGRGCDSLAYVTMGTGIGGGLAISGRSLAGALHPEIGHIRLHRRADDHVPSACPFHGDCAEGLAAGPAILQRLGPGRVLGDDPDTLDLVAGYLGALLATLVLAWSPARIVLGGGVMATVGLPEAAAGYMRAELGGYGVGPAAHAPDFLRRAELDHAGLEGAMIMAREAGGYS